MARAKALNERQERFLDWWLLDERERTPQTLGDWCQQNSVSEPTTRRWRNDPVFKREWAERVTATVGSPERVQSILDTLYQSASEHGDVASAKQYLAYLEKVSPPPVADESESLADLSVEELATLASDLGLRCPHCKEELTYDKQGAIV